MPRTSTQNKNKSKKSDPKPLMKIKINELNDNVIRVPMPDQSKAITIRPLWIDDQVASAMAYKQQQSAFITKLTQIIDKLNDSVEDFFLKSEEYKTSSPEFKKDVRKALQQTRDDFIEELAK